VLTTVTSLISRHGREEEVVRHFKRAFARAEGETHHLSTLLIQQLGGLNFLVSQFANEGELEKWQASPAHREMIRALEQDSLRELCKMGGPVVHVVVPGEGSGPKWKVFVSTWVVTYPLLLVMSLGLTALVPDLPLAARLAFTSVTLSIASIWIITPVAMAWTRTWRLNNQQMQVDVVRYEPPGK